MRDNRSIREMSIEDRVALGAKELDAVMPDWFMRLNARRLKLESECNCVLGQLDGHYFRAGWRIFRRSTSNARWYERRGFVSYERYEEYRDLTRAWKNEIATRKRRARAA